MINLDDWAKIRHLFSTGQHSKREIGRIVGVSRGTVDRALASDRVPKYQRASGASSFDAFAPSVRELLVKTPTMPAATLAERVGWSGSASLFRAKVAVIRPEYAPPDPVDRLVHVPGFQIQCDLWFPHEPLPVGEGQHDTPPVLVMTSAFSGFIQARMLPSRTTPDLLGGMWALIQDAQAVPARLLWDNESGIGRRQPTEPVAAFAGSLGLEVRLLPPRDPESKGMVERMNRFFRQRFMPGRNFASPADFNNQLDEWLPTANHRYSRSRHGRPDELIILDRQKMRPLPPVTPGTVFANTVRLPRDYDVRVFSNDYSVDPSFIGRIVDVTADLDTVTVTHDGVTIASHARVWARHLVITDPAHVARAAVMRRDFHAQRAHRPDMVEARVVESVQVRDLGVYDEIFGTTHDQQPALAEVAS
ncbi:MULTISPECIES: IS21 family transposase [unclassified Arthrobacter]|uniref:IS21 family transposase n=1 Tax=unclassified Arthrobacter TaxID=235627 RepID=UPI0004127510|nr:MULTISPECIES: IS21 family transposase [unclassified Arthrobacter]PVE14767.1 IS21 family transposase [Arthrobacter sp. Bz4]